MKKQIARKFLNELQRDGSEPGREGDRTAPELPYEEESRSKSRPTLSRHMKKQIAKGRSHLAIHKPCHAECAVSESFRTREVSLLHISVVMDVYHRKCQADGWRPLSFMLWLSGELGGEELLHVTPSGDRRSLLARSLQRLERSVSLER